MHEQMKQNIHHSFLICITHFILEKISSVHAAEGSDPVDIWPVSVSTSVFMTSDYLLRGESHVDPSAVYFSIYCNKQGTSMKSPVNMNAAGNPFKIQNITPHLEQILN